jgi:2'-5' RNA ligase
VFVVSHWRTFIAIELSDSVRETIQNAITTLQGSVPSHAIRWVSANNLHLTLKFLGDTPQAQIQAIQTQLHTTAKKQHPFTIEVADSGYFPNMSNPRVIWLGLKNASGELNTLQQAVENIMVEFGFAKEKRPFKPHLTVGRVKQHIDKQILTKIGQELNRNRLGSLAIWECNLISFIKSDLTPNGALYTTLAQLPFNQ